MVCKGVKFRIGRLWGISRISHLLFLWGLRWDDYAGWSEISKVICVDGRLCCMVVVASDMRACGAFVWLAVCRLFSMLNYFL